MYQMVVRPGGSGPQVRAVPDSFSFLAGPALHTLKMENL